MDPYAFGGSGPPEWGGPATGANAIPLGPRARSPVPHIPLIEWHAESAAGGSAHERMGSASQVHGNWSGAEQRTGSGGMLLDDDDDDCTIVKVKNVPKRQRTSQLPLPADMTVDDLAKELTEFRQSVAHMLNIFKAVIPDLTNKLARADQVIEALKKKQTASQAPEFWATLSERRKKIVESMIHEFDEL